MSHNHNFSRCIKIGLALLSLTLVLNAGVYYGIDSSSSLISFGKIVDSRQNGFYSAAQPTIRKDASGTFHLFFSYSGKEYVKSEGPEWDFATPYTSDRINYYSFDTTSIDPDNVPADFLVSIGTESLDDDGNTITEWTEQGTIDFNRQRVWHSNAGHTIVKYSHPSNDPVVADRNKDYYYMYFESWIKVPRILAICVARRSTTIQGGDNLADDWEVLVEPIGSGDPEWITTPTSRDYHPIVVPKVARSYKPENKAVSDAWYPSPPFSPLIHDYIGNPIYVSNWRKSDINDFNGKEGDPALVPCLDPMDPCIDNPFEFVKPVGYVPNPVKNLTVWGLDHGFWGCGAPSAVVVNGDIKLYYVDTTRLVYNEGLGNDDNNSGPTTPYQMLYNMPHPYFFTWDNDWDVSFDWQDGDEGSTLKIVRVEGQPTMPVFTGFPVVYDPATGNYLQFYAKFMSNYWKVFVRVSIDGVAFTTDFQAKAKDIIKIPVANWPAPGPNEDTTIPVNIESDWEGHITMGTNVFILTRKFQPKVSVPLFDFFKPNPSEWNGGRDIYAFKGNFINVGKNARTLSNFIDEQIEIGSNLLYVDHVKRNVDTVSLYFRKEDIWTDQSWVTATVDIFEDSANNYKPHTDDKTAKGWYANATGGAVGSFLTFNLDEPNDPEWDGGSINTHIETNNRRANIRINHPNNNNFTIVPIPINSESDFNRPTSVMVYGTISGSGSNAGVYLTGILEPSRVKDQSNEDTFIRANWIYFGSDPNQGDVVAYHKLWELWTSNPQHTYQLTAGVDANTRLRTLFLPVKSQDQSALLSSDWRLVIEVNDGTWYLNEPDPNNIDEGQRHKLVMEIAPF